MVARSILLTLSCVCILSCAGLGFGIGIQIDTMCDDFLQVCFQERNVCHEKGAGLMVIMAASGIGLVAVLHLITIFTSNYKVCLDQTKRKICKILQENSVGVEQQKSAWITQSDSD